MMLFILGLITGIIGGMGIGGGIILIPGLVFLTALEQQAIQGINLMSFIPVAVIALVVHHKNKSVLLRFTIPIVIIGLGGAWLGSLLALRLSSQLLRRLFGVFLFAMGIYEIIWKGKKNED